MNTSLRRAIGTALLGALTAGTLAACGDSGDGGGSGSGTVTLVTHESFLISPQVQKEFERSSGYKLRILKNGDAGVAVNKAVLSKGNPEGDVFFGVDNTLLSRTLDNDVFAPYEAKGLDRIPERLQLDRGKHRVTPVDTGEICVNYDKKYFADAKLAPPRTFADLVKPEYKNLLVTENPATSSPGLAFLLATAAEYGDEGWTDYWKKLKANGVEVVDGWDQAYNARFSGSSAGKKAGGDRPLVVSYASSPPAEVFYADPRPKQAPTGVATGTCFQQTEFAGLLAGAENEKGGKALLDFLIGKRFQEDVPLTMFVNPVIEGAKLPEVFTEFGAEVDDPRTMAPEKIAKVREPWVKSWSSLVL